MASLCSGAGTARARAASTACIEGLTSAYIAAPGRGAVEPEVRARFRIPSSAGWWFAAAMVTPAAATIAAVIIARSSGHGAPFIPATAIPVMVLIQVVTGAVGEEFGWRGYLLPRLAGRYGETRAVWLMAVAWSLWHVPAFFFPGMPHQSMPAGLAIAAHLSFNLATGAGGVQLSSPVFWKVLLAIFSGMAAVVSLISPTRTAAASR